MRIALAVLAASLAACGGLSTDSAQDAEIQGGKKDTGHPAVGLVWISTGGFCTGTLIAPQAVLTAAHCVADRVSVFYTGTGTASTSVSEPTDLTANAVDKQAQYRSRVNVLDRPASQGIELIGHHEILLPLLHAAVAHRLAAQSYRLTNKDQAA